MGQEKKRYSLRLVGVLFIGVSIALFAVLLFGILHANLPRMLQQAEGKYLQKQMEVVEGVYEDELDNASQMTYDVAIWEEAVRYARGEYPTMIEDSWPDATMLDNYRFNFVYIKDEAGRDLHVEFYDYMEGGYMKGEPLPEPEGFSEYLGGYADLVQREYSTPRQGDGSVRELGLGGILFYDDVPYLVAVMPIMSSRDAGEPAGTVIMGNILSDEYLQHMTHFDTVTFQWITDPEAAKTSPGRDAASTDLVLTDIDGETVTLRMVDERVIYTEGERILIYTTILLLIAVVLFGIAVYLIVVNLMIIPMENISRDIGAIAAEGALEPEKYPKNKEFYSLATAINAMLGRLNESNISLGVLQSILDGQDALIYVSDPADDTILFTNENFLEQFGMLESPVGGRCWAVLHDDKTARCANCPIEYLSGHPGEEVVWEEWNEKARRYFKNTDRLIAWTDGRQVHLHSRVDITPMKQVEDVLQRRLEQQELMSAMSQSFISGKDTDELIMNALQMAGEFMDMSKILLAHYNFEEGFTDFDYQWYNPAEEVKRAPGRSTNIGPGDPMYDKLFVTKEPYIVVEDLSRAIGTGFDHIAKGDVQAFVAVPLLRGENAWGFLIFDDCKGPRSWSPSDIQLVRLIGSVISGVIEQHETEQKLMQMSSIVESSPQYITFVDGTGRIEYINPGASLITGYTQEELKNQTLAVLFSDENAQYAREEALPAILQEGKFEFEIPIRRKDGEKRIMHFSNFAVAGEKMGVGCIGTDVTAQREMERELVAAREKAEQSSLAKGNFLSRMSHEMRTPLNAVIGMTSIARGTDDAERKEYCLDKIDEASTHLLGVVNDILDMSKIEAGKLELAYGEFDFEKMLVRVTGVMNFRIDEKKQDLVVRLDRGLPRYIYSDEQRLAQVITNLLGNAVKFTGEGGTVTLTVGLIETEGDTHTLQVEVKDTGIGISPEQQARLFRSFEQADGGISRKFGGTGLGLAISKSIIEAMGGEIWVESELGQGATFAFRLQVKRGSEPEKGEGPALNISTVRVLAVDDAEEIREYFKEISDTLGFYCDVAESGFEAVSLIEAAGEKGYHIFFIDWRMPEMDGVELARKIRALYGEGVVIIMISAAEWSEIEEEARRAGVDGFVAKPLFSSLILDCINRYLAPEKPAGVGEQQDCFTGRRVLLAEDVEINREIVYAMLEDIGLEIESAENGVEVLEKFKADPDRYDLILMDIHMPEMDGYRATEELRALPIPRAKEIPIIAMTANVFREDVERCLAAGMNDHIGKPINFEEMVEKLRAYLPGGDEREADGNG